MEKSYKIWPFLLSDYLICMEKCIQKTIELFSLWQIHFAYNLTLEG